MGKLILIVVFTLVELLLLLTRLASASLPPQIFYYVTVRSFMPARCRSDVTDAIRSSDCPNDATIRSHAKSGLISGHPDFQRRDEPRLYAQQGGHTAPYNTSFAQFGKQFPLTNSGSLKPVVLSTLQYGSTGIGKMRYCSSSADEGYACDATQDPRSVFNKDSFSTWHEDNVRYNKRMGYKQKLFLIGSQYSYDTRNVDHDNDNFYDPIQENGLLSKAWPLSPIEESNGNRKFWITTEIHSSFEYQGNEVFTFSGDDDVHVFINGILAVNLGGEHGRQEKTINLASYAQELNLTVGNIYAFDLFHAERQTAASNYALTTTLAETCNVVTSDFRSGGDDIQTSIDWRSTGTGSTNDSEWFIVGGPGWGFIDQNQAVLMAPSIPNVVGYMFHRSQHNVGSGFAFSFKFKMTGEGHGFAVLIHDRELGLRDFNGGTGPNLGIRNTDNSFAIVFDACPAFPDCSTSRMELRIHYKTDGDRMNRATNETRTKFDDNVVQDWRDGEEHEVEILYYAVPDWLEVYVDNSLRLVEQGFSMEQVVGGRDAFVGFSSSSSDTSTMMVNISDVSIKTVKVVERFSEVTDEAALLDELPLTIIANSRDFAEIRIHTRDACENDLEFGGSLELAHMRVLAHVDGGEDSTRRRMLLSDEEKINWFEMEDSNGKTVKVREQHHHQLFQKQRQLEDNETDSTSIVSRVVDLDDGSYSYRLSTNLVANFSLFIAFGRNCTWNGTEFLNTRDCFASSYLNAVESLAVATQAPTFTEETSPIDSAALTGIGVASGVVFCLGGLAVFAGIRVRNQWRRDKQYLEAGRKAAAEKGVNYMGDAKIDELQAKLQNTLMALQAEKARKAKSEDKSAHIAELMRQKGELQETVRRMKAQKEGLDPDADAQQLQGLARRFRKSFAVSRASRGISLFAGSHVEGDGAGSASSAATANPRFSFIRRQAPSQVAVNDDAMTIAKPPPLPDL